MDGVSSVSMMGGGAVKQASDGDYDVSVRDLEERMRGSPSVHSKSNCGLLPTSIVKGACHRLDSNLYNFMLPKRRFDKAEPTCPN